MNCVKCNKSANEVGVLHRTTPLGEIPANWTCERCLKVSEPELLNNIKEDSDFVELLEDLQNI